MHISHTIGGYSLNCEGNKTSGGLSLSHNFHVKLLNVLLSLYIRAVKQLLQQKKRSSCNHRQKQIQFYDSGWKVLLASAHFRTYLPLSFLLSSCRFQLGSLQKRIRQLQHKLSLCSTSPSLSLPERPAAGAAVAAVGPPAPQVCECLAHPLCWAQFCRES